ncbi:MAG: nodulation protein NodH [Pseudomonadota bacterium]
MTGSFDAFVILAEMRTGSNALEERLNDFEGLKSYGEVFNRSFIGGPGKSELLGVTLKERDGDPQTLLAALRAGTDGLPGFRLFSGHDPRVLDRCLADRRTAKIILTRNLLDSYVSLKIAKSTGQWWLGKRGKPKVAKARFDPVEFEEFSAARLAHLAQVRHRLRASGQTAFEIGYHEIGDEKLIEGCARYLGATRRRAEEGRKGRVQNPVPLSEKVSNFEEMRVALAARDPMELDLAPVHEPSRGPNVPSFIGSDEHALLYMPIKCAADAEVAEWLGKIEKKGSDGLQRGFTQKSLRAWKRRQGPHRSFTVVAHPLLRAHAAFCRFIVPVGPGTFSGIRAVLARNHNVILPDDPDDAGYDAAAHRTAFLNFLRFLRANLGGQTSVRVDSAWASQSACVSGLAEFGLPDAILRAETLRTGLSAFVSDAAAPPPLNAGAPFSLAEVYSDALEAAARSVYQRDYMMFGYGSWR